MIAIVGEAPSRTSDPRRPFVGGSNQRKLELLLSLAPGELPLRLRLVNLLDRWPGSAAGKGARFPYVAAARAARRTEFDGPVLLAGLRVARAFGIAPTLFGETTLCGWPALVIPHPSGVSHWWNCAERVADGRRRVAAFISKEVPMP